MQSNLDLYLDKYLNWFGPVVFRPGFNRGESITANQAWSLFFTAGKNDTLLGSNLEMGRFLTNALIAIIVSGSLASVFFKNYV
jgi:esterase/lipase superfamily enzyme